MNRPATSDSVRPAMRPRFGLRALFLLLTLIPLVFLVFPKLLTGDYAKIKGSEIASTDEGAIQYRFRIQRSAGSEVVAIGMTGGGTEIRPEGSQFRLPTWAEDVVVTVTFNNYRTPRHAWTTHHEECEGKTIRIGDQLLIDARPNEGNIGKTWLVVRQGNRLGW